MTQTTIEGKHKGRWSGGREQAAVPHAGRHRLGMFAAIGAVAVGAIALAGAVSGSIWSGASVDRAAAARQTSPNETPRIADAAVTPAKATQTAKAAPVPAEAAKIENPSAAAKPEPTRVAGGKSNSLSPDERIERAMDRVTAGSTDASIKKAIKVAAREKGDDLQRRGADTTITAALPDSAAYAPASEAVGPQHEDGALDAIRELDKSTREAALEPTPSKDESAQERDEAPAKEPANPAAAKPSGPMASASVTAAVHLRAGMDNKTAVVATVPAGARVQASQNCEGWCEVVYDGRRGYVYKNFIRRQAATAQASTDASAKAAATETASSPDTPASATPASSNKSATGRTKGILAQTGSADQLVEAAQRAMRSR